MACEGLLFADVYATGRGAMRSHEEIVEYRRVHRPVTGMQKARRWVSINMTAVVWVGYLMFLEGVLHVLGGSPVRKRPHHFFMLALASVTIWCVFDTVNFYSIRAWRYIGMPESDLQRMTGYLFAFATIVPGMLMSGQVMLKLGWFDWARTRPFVSEKSGRVFRRWVLPMSLIVGLGMLIWPLVHPDPITNLTLWTSLVFLLDPINYALGRPSMFRDWQH